MLTLSNIGKSCFILPVAGLTKLKYGKSTIYGNLINGYNRYCFSSVGQIRQMNEIKNGRKFLIQKNIDGAQEMYERALDILPFYIQDNAEYNEEFELILEQYKNIYVDWFKFMLGKASFLRSKAQLIEYKANKNSGLLIRDLK